MSAIHGHCSLCGRMASLVWAQVPSKLADPTNVGSRTLARRVCAGCASKLPAAKPKGTVEK